jgi:hypothetical protein
MTDQLTKSGSHADYAQDTTSDQGKPPPSAGTTPRSRLGRSASWKPVDLSPYLDGTYEPPVPSVGVHRTDGLHFLYPGKHHEILGETESGKTWFCLMAALAEMRKGNKVVYIHFEECDPGSTIERLKALGATNEELLAQFLFVGPVEKCNSQSVQALADESPSLVVLDGVNEAMGVHGWDIYGPTGYTQYKMAVVRPFLSVGASTLEADHVTKAKEGRGNNAFGTVHKGNSIDGCRISLENAVPFGRNRIGKSKVSVTKDRPGYLRMHGSSQKMNGSKSYMGMLLVDDTQDTLKATLTAVELETDSNGHENADATKVLEVLRAAPDCQIGSTSKIREALKEKYDVGMQNQRLVDALKELVGVGTIQEIKGRNGAAGYKVLNQAN